MKNVKISVRGLVEFILREGDLDNRRTHSSDTAMIEGGRIHRKIQHSMGSIYRAEVPLSYTYLTREKDFTITIDGRADGIIDTEPVVIDEIKGTYRFLHKLENPDNVHLAQAKCYAYIYAKEEELAEIDVQMTYCNLDTEELKYFNYHYEAAELEEWFTDLMERYAIWARMEIRWHEKRDDSLAKVKFPFDYRRGQKELITHVYHTIAHKRKLFLEAPTGVGKTISTVFPTVKAMGVGKVERIFYLTAKTITRTVADNTFQILRRQGMHFKSVIITAKDKICFSEERLCNPEACPYAKGHFDRINEALFAILNEEENYSREIIEDYAIKYQVCPFELCLDISLFCDGIICDYNYLFDPHVYLKRFFADGKTANNVFLIDEAHNLVDRGRSMYTATLIKEDFLNLKKSVKVYDATMAKRLEKCNHELLLMKRECTDIKVMDSIEPFVHSLERLYESMSTYLENHDASPVRDEVLDFFFEVSHFLYIYDLLDEKYIVYSYMLGNGDFGIRLYCVDPSKNLSECMKRGISSILFSATLLPIQYHKKLLGGTSEDYEVYAESTFDRNKRGLYIAEGVTSKYSERGQKMYRDIAEYIHEIAVSKKGNYIAFFPSYSFMNSTWDVYIDMYGEENGINPVLQSEHMTEEERENFLRMFENGYDGEEGINTIEVRSDRGLLGFCVLGGIFSEGIDLKNDSLIGAIIVGTGIPMVCKENELIKDYFDEIDGNGMKYAYIYPGFNKVLQAAGRVIRTHEDVGVVALLDYRFKNATYRELYPKEWDNIQSINMANLGQKIGGFWEINGNKFILDN
ncbi:MAG: ATP-dependent DNA helicase [Lachnospiraceae bacterium]|nr:ATP-dependent DNA helicase [Candidatus Colinaster scatohippi]